MQVIRGRPEGVSAASLIIVYGVDASLLGNVRRMLTGRESASGTPCPLAAITLGRFGLREEWKRFLASLPVATRLYRRSEFRRAFPGLASNDSPAVYHQLYQDMIPTSLLSAADIETLSGLEELQARVLEHVPGSTGG